MTVKLNNFFDHKTKKMKFIQLNKPILFTLLGIAVSISSCTKSLDGFVEDPSTSRAFVPGNFRVRTVQDSAKFTWDLPILASGKKYAYRVDLSKDSLFSNIDYSVVSDTTGINILEPTINVNQKYFARIRVDAYNGVPPSKYVYATSSFSVSGQQYLRVIRDFEVTKSSVLLHWFVNANTAGINKIKVTNGTVVTEVLIAPSEATVGTKLVPNLNPDTRYTIQLLADTKSKGLTSITTSKDVLFTKTLSPGEDLATAINTAVDGDVIGLNPGVYAITSAFTMTGKSITLRSTSNNPNDTKIKIREFNLAGSNAGLTLNGLDIDGNYSGASYGQQFLQLKGAVNAGDAANFADVKFDNCIIHDFTRCLVRGNYGAVANAHVIKTFTINNCTIYNIDRTGIDTYYTFSIEKLQFTNLSITKSTLYTLGSGLFNVGTAYIGTAFPTITIDYCTFNNFGGSGKYLFIDANANRVVFNFRNSIVANTPLAVSVAASALRSTNNTSALNFINNNYFKLNSSTAASTPLNLTGLNQVNNTQINLGWASSTTNFNLSSLPADSPILKGSTNGSTIGDPKWAY